jgi:hypothetical protein
MEACLSEGGGYSVSSSYRTLWSNGWHLFVYGRARTKISARRPTVLTEIFLVFSQSLQANYGVVP